MKLKSSIKLTAAYNIDEVLNDKIKVTFVDLNSEVIEETKHEETTGIEYVYDAYQIDLMNDENYIKKNYDDLLLKAKNFELNNLANVARLKRKKLLEETDNYAMTDRVMSNEMKEYRQLLRDVPEQEGFPYDITWPKKPKE